MPPPRHVLPPHRVLVPSPPPSLPSLQPAGWVQVRGLLLPASLLLLAATVALSAHSSAADVVDPGSSVVAQLSMLAARLASRVLVLCGRGLLRLAGSAADSGDGVGPLARAAAALRGVGAVLLALPDAGGLEAMWHSSGGAALLAECTGFWVRMGEGREKACSKHPECIAAQRPSRA